jgi:uncharacterized phage protein (predicted DNA packaging)
MPIEDEDDAPPPLITVADVKRHLNLDLNDGFHDALVESKLEAASDWVASHTGAAITSATAPRVREAILMLTAHLFNNREMVLVGVTAQQLPFGLLDLLADYRAWCA